MMTIRPKVFKKGEEQRFGKGFSQEEVRKAGLSLKSAVKSGIPVDSKRKTAHKENIEAVKAFLQKKEAPLRPKKSKRKSKS